MPLKSKRSPAEGEFLFEIDEQPTEECLTALGGVPLFVRTAQSPDVPGSVKRNLALKQRDRGFDEATYIESFLVLNAVGGGLLEDFDCLREDRGLAAMTELFSGPMFQRPGRQLFTAAEIPTSAGHSIWPPIRSAAGVPGTAPDRRRPQIGRRRQPAGLVSAAGPAGLPVDDVDVEVHRRSLPRRSASRIPQPISARLVPTKAIPRFDSRRRPNTIRLQWGLDRARTWARAPDDVHGHILGSDGRRRPAPRRPRTGAEPRPLRVADRSRPRSRRPVDTARYG